MPRLFYKGKLSPLLKVGLISNNIIAWMNGNSRDTGSIKKRIQDGYEAAFSDDVSKYDELTLSHYVELAERLLDGIDCRDKTVIDVGCGTGILSNMLLERGARKVVCIDFSQYMIEQCKIKFSTMGYSSEKIEFRRADAEKLPFEDNMFDLAVSGMMLGLVVDQGKIISEMYRVLQPGGRIAVSTHGPEWYYEIVETLSMCLLRYYTKLNLGSSGGVEFWPITENIFHRILTNEKFVDTTIKIHKGHLNFKDGKEAWAFFAACSSAWFLGVFKPEERQKVIATVNAYFLKKKTTSVTYEALMGYGTKK